MTEISPGPSTKHHTFESGGTLTLKHGKDDVISSTIGHLVGIQTRLLLGTPQEIFQEPPKELMDQLYERYKDVPWKGDLLVRVGYDSIIEDYKRLFGKGINGRPNVFLRILGAPSILKDALMAKLSKADHFNPLTNTVTVYHPKMAVGMHELGHAEFWDQSKYRDLWTGAMIASEYVGPFNFFKPAKSTNEMRLRKVLATVPGFRFYTEWKASQNAMSHFKTDQEQKEAMKLLEPAFGSYTGFEVANMYDILQKDQENPLRSFIITHGIAPIVGVVGGHLAARVPKERKSSFGVLFQQEKSDDFLENNQVLVGSSKSQSTN